MLPAARVSVRAWLAAPAARAFTSHRRASTHTVHLTFRAPRCVLVWMTVGLVFIMLMGASYCGGLNVSSCISGGVKASEEWIESKSKEAREPKHPL